MYPKERVYASEVLAHVFLFQIFESRGVAGVAPAFSDASTTAFVPWIFGLVRRTVDGIASLSSQSNWRNVHDFEQIMDWLDII